MSTDMNAANTWRTLVADGSCARVCAVVHVGVYGVLTCAVCCIQLQVRVLSRGLC